MLRRIMVPILMGWLLFSVALPVPEAAATPGAGGSQDPSGAFARHVPEDVAGHWARETIEKWLDANRVSGYPDGLFRPGRPVTRAEFMVMANSAFGFQGGSAVRFSDVPDRAWYSDAVKTAVGAGYIDGYPNGTIRPNSPISRQEVAAVLVRILALGTDATKADTFRDAAQIAAWSRPAVGAVVSGGIMAGYPDGRFRPTNSITRAEAVTALDKAMLSTEIPNASMETPDPRDPGRPEGWQTSSWGNHDAVFRYLRDGFLGNRSVAVDVSNYQDGDAKWYFDPVRLSPGEYTFQNAYQSNVTTQVTLAITDVDGRVHYMGLPDAPPSPTWTRYEAFFVMPSDATHITVLHRLTQNGYLYTDGYAFERGRKTGSFQTDIPSLETPDPADPGRPAGWYTNTWGEHETVFRYLSEGYTGSHSLRVDVSNYTSGDAKWVFSPIRLAPGDYLFRNAYRSNVATRVTLAITDGKGQTHYVCLPEAMASSAWRVYEAPFVMPPDATHITAFHRLTQNGYLVTDEYSFLEDADRTGIQLRVLCMETPDPGDPGRPAGWQTNRWGDHDAVFRYLHEGYGGSRSLRVDISEYKSGDAKWHFTPIRLGPGDYSFRSMYRSDATTRVTLAISDAYHNVVRYMDLPNAPPSDTWTQYKAEFSMPEDGAYITVLHRLAGNGFLNTSDYHVEPYTYEGFARGLVTLTFDDGWEKNLSFDPAADVALNILREYGYPITQFFATTFLEYPLLDNWQELIRHMFRDGHEIGSHSVTHPDLTTLPPEEVLWELQESRNFLLRHFGAVPYGNFFATPYGSYDPGVVEAIMSIYDAHRSVDAGWNARNNFDIANLKVQNVLYTTTAEEVRAWTQKAKEDKTWLILLYHEITDLPGSYDTTPQLFREHLEAIRRVGVPVRTMSEALEEIGTQIPLSR